MATERTTRRTVRMLVALEGTPPNEACLRAVSGLLRAEILEVTGLYVEDEELLHAAAIPGLREISLSGQESALDATRLASDLAAEADAVGRAFERLLERLGEHRRLEHHFRVTRGPVAEELDRAAAGSDFVMVSRALRGSGLRARIGRSFARLARQPRHVLFVNEPWDSGSSVVTLHTSDDQTPDFAARFAEAEKLRLVVAAPAAAPHVPVLANAAVRTLASWDGESIAELCLREDARLLVMPELPSLDWAELVVSLMDRLPCSVLKLAPDPS